MESLAHILLRLHREMRQAQYKLEKIEAAIKALERLVKGLNGRGSTRANQMSTAGRRRIALAQKARWAAWRARK